MCWCVAAALAMERYAGMCAWQKPWRIARRCPPSRDILVVKETDDRYLPYMKMARAIVCENSNVSSHTAVYAIKQGKPAIIGALGITEQLKTGDSVSLYISRGRVFRRS